MSRLYMKRKEGGRGLISVEDCITAEMRGLHDHLKESKEDMVSGTLQNVKEEERQRRNCQKGKGWKKENFA